MTEATAEYEPRVRSPVGRWLDEAPSAFFSAATPRPDARRNSTATIPLRMEWVDDNQLTKWERRSTAVDVWPQDARAIRQGEDASHRTHCLRAELAAEKGAL